MSKISDVKITRDYNTARDIVATWTWTEGSTKNADGSVTDKTSGYNIRWWYVTKMGISFLAEEKNISNLTPYSRITMPSDAIKMWFTVQPVSYTYRINDSEAAYWVADWSTDVEFWDVMDFPSIPSAPTVEIEDIELTAKLENLTPPATYVEFEVYENDRLYKVIESKIEVGAASCSCIVNIGGRYRVRCRSFLSYVDEAKDWRTSIYEIMLNANMNDVYSELYYSDKAARRYSDFSEYSDPVDTKPIRTEFIDYRAASKTSVYLSWSAVFNAKSYTLEWVTKIEDFDSDRINSQSGITTTNIEKTGLETGQRYYFRVKAVNDSGEGDFNDIVSVVIGTTPVAPTTWSASTTVMVSEKAVLYWVHNSEDMSHQTYAQVEIKIGSNVNTYTINTKSDQPEEGKVKTYNFDIDTSSYIEGTTIEWRIRTAGITEEYGEWSISRKINIYAKPILSVEVTGKGTTQKGISEFPIYISMISGPETQKAIAYNIDIISNDEYDILDNSGNIVKVKPGNIIYSKFVNASANAYRLTLQPGDIQLNTNSTYSVDVTVSMDSGLTTKETVYFTASFEDSKYKPNAELSFDPDSLVAYIHPYCIDDNGNYIENARLSVHRIEYDGKFKEIARNIPNEESIFIVDPHPSLDYARYRIVSSVESTTSYYDIPAYPINVKCVTIQWDDIYMPFYGASGYIKNQPWVGSILKLPYNIDISENAEVDTSLIKYYGRSYPVGYYGTQVSYSSTWNMEIPKKDKETIYLLRRLAIYTGDVYVREPSGSGYWANVKVSFDTKHLELTIPITLTLTRVEGGI